MKIELDEMIETYKRLIETEGMPPAERAFLAKKRRDAWWEIRQAIKKFPKAFYMKVYRSSHPEKALEQY